jgi:phosphoribosylformylglycinamidine cyclo-ligase
VRYVKDALPEPDPIFHVIQAEGRVEWREMYEDFNMGIGFEFIVAPEAAEDVIRIAENFGIDVQIVGRCEESGKGNALKISSRLGEFSYAGD